VWRFIIDIALCDDMVEALMVLTHLYFAVMAFCLRDEMAVSLQRLGTPYAAVFLIVPFADWYPDLVITQVQLILPRLHSLDS
jgi:hypothetical protein